MQAYIYSCASPRASTWLLTCPTTLAFHLSLAHFLTTLHTRLGLPHFSMAHLSQCKCDHIIDDLGTHLLKCLYRNEHTTTHNTFWDNVATIFLESGTHVQREVSHLFPRHIWHQMDILITKDNLWTLMDIVIAYSTHINMKQRTSTTTTHVVMMTTQEKTQSYIERIPSNDFIPLAMETYGCLYFCFDSLFIACAHTTITRYQRSSLVPSMLVFYYQQHVFATLQNAQTITIL
jgi:hypothetical protein